MSARAVPKAMLPGAQPGGTVWKFQRQFQIIYALMMHDIKNRFFGSGLGQIIMVFWPFAHILVLIIIYVVTNRPHPYGDSLLQYSAVSIYPFICFNYTSRWICFSAAQNKNFLQYPIIKPLDILIARSCLEIVSIAIVGIALIILVVAVGDNPMPADPGQAVFGIMATMFLSVGFGFLNAAFAFAFPLWLLVMTLFIILLYVSSGIIFVPSNVPQPFQYYLSFNPLLNCVEWMRSAYYSDYPTVVLDKPYVLECALVFLTLGLLLQRALRRLY